MNTRILIEYIWYDIQSMDVWYGILIQHDIWGTYIGYGILGYIEYGCVNQSIDMVWYIDGCTRYGIWDMVVNP